MSRPDLTPPAIPATPADSQPSSERHRGASEETRAGLDSPTQMQFMAVVRTCHVCGSEKVVGNSVRHRDNRYVCRKHNLEEWAESLLSNKDPYYRELGRRLRGDARKAA